MSDDTAFLRAIVATPDDAAPRLVYADWLEEWGDQRAEYLRLTCRLATSSIGQGAAADRRRLAALRADLPRDWLAALGDYRSAGSDPDPRRTESVAAALRRPVRLVTADGYEHLIVATAPHPLGDAVAYVECRSRQVRPDYLDINYFLNIRTPEAREAAWPIESYNPYFGCDVRFLEWYGDVAITIYQEKHRVYVCRFGLAVGAAFAAIEDDWVLDGRQLGHRGYGETLIRRLAIPGLEELPPLSAAEAGDWNLVPPTSS